MFPFVKAGGVQPFDAIYPIKVGVGRDDVGYAKPLHDGGVDEVAGVYARIAFDHLSRENDVIRVDGFNAALHCLGELIQCHPAFRPTTRGDVIVNDLLQGLGIREEGASISRHHVEDAQAWLSVSMLPADRIDRYVGINKEGQCHLTVG